MKASFWRTSNVIGDLALGLLILIRLISEYRSGWRNRCFIKSAGLTRTTAFS